MLAAGLRNIEVFSAFLLTQLGAVLLVIPAITSTAISGERERGTYEALYSTLLSPFAIIFAKILAPVGYVILVLLSSAPAVCVLYLLGGISFGSFLRCYAVTLAAVILAGFLCLTASMRSRRNSYAVVRGIVWVVFWNLGLLFLCQLVFLLLMTSGGLQNRSMEAVFMLVGPCISPLIPIMFEMRSPAPLPFMIAQPWVLYLGFAGLLSLLHLAYLLRQVRKPELALGRWRERRLAGLAQRKASGSLPRRKARRQTRALLTRVLCWLGEQGVSGARNPVFLKEIRSEVFGRPWFRRLLFWIPLAIFVAIAAIDAPWFHLNEKIATINTVALTLTLLLVPAIAASSFPREIEQGNMDFLRGTLLPSSEVLGGKFLASLYSCTGIVLATACVNTALVTFDTQLGNYPPLVVFVLGFGVLSMNLLFTTALSTLASVLAKRSVVAMVATYVTALCLYAGFPVALEIANAWEADLLMATNPYVAVWFDDMPSHDRPLICAPLFLLLSGVGTVLLCGAATSVVVVKGARD